MQIEGDPIRVRLSEDLTRYDSRCKSGSCGYTIPNVKLGIWGSQDRFVAVDFDSGAKLDILWESLEIIDKEHLKKIKDAKKKKSKELR